MSDWTMAKEGMKRVELFGKDDKTADNCVTL